VTASINVSGGFSDRSNLDRDITAETVPAVPQLALGEVRESSRNNVIASFSGSRRLG